MAGLPPAAGTISADGAPAGAVDLGYQPPCPPPGSVPHVLVFRLYAVSTPLGIAAGTSTAQAVDRISATPAQVAELTSVLGR